MIQIPGTAFLGSAQASPPQRAKISMTMAMDSLREQVAMTAEARDGYDRERAIRDDLIRDARAGGIPVAVIMRATGLSRDRVGKINATTKEIET